VLTRLFPNLESASLPCVMWCARQQVTSERLALYQEWNGRATWQQEHYIDASPYHLQHACLHRRVVPNSVGGKRIDKSGIHIKSAA
jgi:hypothetical protein